jgi:hypothetical protein
MRSSNDNLLMTGYGPELTSRHVRVVIAIERKADVTRTSPEDRP